MVEAVHQQLVNELSRFVNKNLLLIVADMKRDWWNAKTFLLWVNEKKNKRLVPMDRECQGSLWMKCSWYQDWWRLCHGWRWQVLAQNYNTNGLPPATQCYQKFKDIAFCVLLIEFAWLEPHIKPHNINLNYFEVGFSCIY